MTEFYLGAWVILIHDSPYMTLLWVFIGGGIGASLRFLTGQAWSSVTINLFNKPFPIATFTCNLIGCLLIGVISGILLKNPQLESPVRPLLITGLMGGYTTFSSFALELVKFQQGNDWLPLLGYAGLSLILGIALCALGLSLTVNN